MNRATGVAWMLAMCAGCPEIERMTFRFDLRTGEGRLLLFDIGTSEPEAAARDFAALVNEYLIGDRLETEHPGWRILDKRLVEAQGRLDGEVSFSFASAFDAGLYQMDKKSGLLWCAQDGTEVVSTTGTVVPLYPRCVVFDRKSSVAEVTVTTLDRQDRFDSLLPSYLRWDGGPIGSEAVLADLLADVPVPDVFRAVGLPLPGGTVVFAEPGSLEVTHAGSTAALVERYGAALASSGFTRGEVGDDRAVWERAGERWFLSATQAGKNALVSIRRSETESGP